MITVDINLSTKSDYGASPNNHPLLRCQRG